MCGELRPRPFGGRRGSYDKKSSSVWRPLGSKSSSSKKIYVINTSVGIYSHTVLFLLGPTFFFVYRNWFVEHPNEHFVGVYPIPVRPVEEKMCSSVGAITLIERGVRVTYKVLCHYVYYASPRLVLPSFCLSCLVVYSTSYLRLVSSL